MECISGISIGCEDEVTTWIGFAPSSTLVWKLCGPKSGTMTSVGNGCFRTDFKARSSAGWSRSASKVSGPGLTGCYSRSGKPLANPLKFIEDGLVEPMGHHDHHRAHPASRLDHSWLRQDTVMPYSDTLTAMATPGWRRL